jgi:16S rRNA (guanine966-N2)-methyltransferase
VTAILQSLARTSLAAAGKVVRGRLPGALASIQGQFDIIFVDPPYNDPAAEETLIAAAAKLAEGGIVVYEHGSRYNPPQRLPGLALEERRVYGDSALAFYVRQEGE